MNIFIINYEYPPLGGGAGVATKSLVKALATNGHKIIVLTTHIRGEKFVEKSENIVIYRVPVIGRKNLHKASLISLFTWPFTSLICGFYICLKHKIDIINTHFFAPSGPIGLILSIFFRIPNVIYSHGGDVYEPANLNFTPSGKGIVAKFLLLSLRIQARQAAIIMTNSTSLKNRIYHLTHTPTQIEVVPLPFERIDSDRIKKTKSGDNFQIISIGRFIERKGFGYLIRSLTLLPENITLTLIGDGPLRESFEKLINELNLENRVTLTGYISQEEREKKFEFLASADCFVLSSLYEPMGIVIHEAMHMGLPVISTNQGGPVDLIEENINGFLIKPKSFKAIANAVRKLYSNSQLREKMSENNLKKVKEFFAENVVKIYEKYFEEIINR